LIEDDVPAARDFLERAVKATPFDNSAHQKFSTVLLRLGEKEAAKKEAERAKELLDLQLRSSELNNQASQRPKDIEVRKELAALARQLGREEEAKRWERVVEGMRDDPVSELQGPTVSFPKDRMPAIPIGPQPRPKLQKTPAAKGKGR
jgi:tetratricopeptide (TPR) repeat protein